MCGFPLTSLDAYVEKLVRSLAAANCPVAPRLVLAALREALTLCRHDNDTHVLTGDAPWRKGRDL